MELKDFKEYAVKTLLEYKQLNKELQTLRESYIVSLNTFFEDNKELYYSNKEEFSKEFLNSDLFNQSNYLAVHKQLINEKETEIKIKYTELVQAINMLDTLKKS